MNGEHAAIVLLTIISVYLAIENISLKRSRRQVIDEAQKCLDLAQMVMATVEKHLPEIPNEPVR